MKHTNSPLKAFRRRVRLLRSWRGAAIGGTIGGAVGCIWAVLDLFRVAYSEWLWLGLVVAVGALLGAMIGAALGISDEDLAASIDRRAQLEDRLTTMLSPSAQQESSFWAAQRADAEQKFAAVEPRHVFPARWSRWHFAFAVACLLTAMVFTLGNTSLFLSPEQKGDRVEEQKTAEQVERVAKPLLESPLNNQAEKALAKQLEAYRDELKKARLSKQEAMLKADDLSKQADELAKQRFEKADESLQTAQSSFDKMQDQVLQKAGFDKVDPNLLKQSESSLKAQEATLRQQIQDIQKSLQTGKSPSGNNLTDAEKKAMQEQLKALQKLLRQVKLSQRAKDFLKKLQSNPEWKKLTELFKELAKKAQKGKSGEQAMISKEELEKELKELEDLARDMEHASEADIKDLIKSMEEALKHMGQGGKCKGIGLGLGLGLGLFQMPTMGSPGPGDGMEQFFADTHKIPVADKPTEVKASADAHAVTGDRREQGSETYVEVKGPSGIGSKSRTPYVKVLTKYRKQAEQALQKQQIPPDQQKRVKDYFNSLQGGG